MLMMIFTMRMFSRLNLNYSEKLVGKPIYVYTTERCVTTKNQIFNKISNFNSMFFRVQILPLSTLLI